MFGERKKSSADHQKRSVVCAACGDEILIKNVYEGPEVDSAPTRVIGPDGQLLAVIHIRCTDEFLARYPNV